MSNWSIPKRFLRLTLFAGGESEQTSDKILAKADINANISFSTKAAVYGQSAEANISIVGLTTSKMAHLATSYNLYNKNKVYNSLRIDAGYDNKHAVIYTGTIVEAIPSLDTADYNINLKCLSFQNYLKKEIKSKSYKGETDVKKICSDIAEMVGGAVLDYNVDEEVKVTDYAFSDINPINMMRDLSNATGLNIWLEATQSEKGTLVVTKRDEPRKKSVYTINLKNMVGAPSPTPIGCEVDVRMDSSIQAGLPVKIESKKFEILNSQEYFINSYSHSGQTKGNKWITHLSLTRKKIYEK